MFLPIPVIHAFSLVIGLLSGSFVAGMSYRLPRGKDFVFGRSSCASCGHDLHIIDLLPVFSWLITQRRCRYCEKPVSQRYVVIELVCGTLFLAASIALMSEDPARVAITWIMAIVLLALSVINIEHNSSSTGLVVSAALLSIIIVLYDGRSLLEAIIGAALALICALIFREISRLFCVKGLPFCVDVKLIGALGLVVYPEKALVFFGAFCAVAVVLAAVLVWCRCDNTLPFSAALCAGAFVTLL